MSRRPAFRSAAATLGLGTVGGLFAACARGPRNPYYSGPVSDHFDGTRFFRNPIVTAVVSIVSSSVRNFTMRVF